MFRKTIYLDIRVINKASKLLKKKRFKDKIAKIIQYDNLSSAIPNHLKFGIICICG